MSNTHVQRIVNAALVASLAFTGSYMSAPAILADEALPKDATNQNDLASMVGTTGKTGDVTIKQGDQSVQHKGLSSSIATLKSGAETSGNEPTSEPTNTPEPTPASTTEPKVTLSADTFVPQRVAYVLQVLLDSSRCDREQRLVRFDMMLPGIVAEVVIDLVRDRERAALAGLLFGNVQTVPLPVAHDVVQAQAQNVADPHAQVRLRREHSSTARIRSHGSDPGLHCPDESVEWEKWTQYRIFEEGRVSSLKLFSILIILIRTKNPPF